MAPAPPVAVLALWLLAVWLLAASPAAAGGAPPAAGPVTSQAAARSPADPANGEYQIGADDTLEITVFQVPELSRTVQVDRNGEFVLPILGRVPAAGKTADELTAFLTDKLQGRYLKDPVIAVVVKVAAKNRVTVDGAVIKPGVYPLTGPTSLMQAVALANGPDPRVANMKRVTIVRAVDGRRESQTYDLAKIRDGKAVDPGVDADDIIIVEASSARSFFTYYSSALTALSLLRPY
jgi:polysaccharide export outer membrane protein